MRSEVRRLAPFHHAIDLPYGLSTHDPEFSQGVIYSERVSNLLAHAWPALLAACRGSLSGRRVLDIGCNCGGFSVEATKSGADYALGIDIVDRYVEQANFIRRALELENVEFRKLAIEDIDPSDVGTFDISFCFGILYHLENPVSAMRKVADVTEQIVVVDTNLNPDYPAEPYWRMRTRNPMGPAILRSGQATTALWRERRTCEFVPTVRAVEELLGFLGFGHVEQLDVATALEPRYHKQKRGIFIATRSDSGDGD
jgi:tRNA (mo5U34)-methyltransferase